MENINNGDARKENFTFRIEPKTMQIIKNRSKVENSSINQYVNNLLRISTEWNIYAPSAGWVPMPKQLLLTLVDKFTENELSEISHKKGKEIAQDILLFMDGKYDIDSWVNFLRIRASASGFQYSEQIENNTIRCVIHHGMGKKWSVYFASFYENVFSDLKKHVKFDVAENTIAMIITR